MISITPRPSHRLIFRLYVFVFFTFYGLTGFAANGNIKKLLPTKGCLIEDISYKQTPLGYIKLDVYRPDTTTMAPTPVVIFIHGGSWMHGSKDEITKSFQAVILKRILKEGIAVVSIDYRLVNDSFTVLYPEPLTDCKDAIHWIRANSNLFHFDINRIALMGTSAGAHLALMTAYTPDSIIFGTDAKDLLPTTVKCVVDFYGPTHLGKMLRPTLPPIAITLYSLFTSHSLIKMRANLLWAFTQESASHPWKRQNKCHFYSPVFYTNNAVPTIIFHGNKDSLVPYTQSKLLVKNLIANGKIVEMHTLQGEDHTFPTITKAATKDMGEQLIHFLDTYLKK